jgi:hypothetical protein
MSLHKTRGAAAAEVGAAATMLLRAAAQGDLNRMRRALDMVRASGHRASRCPCPCPC